MQIPFFSKSAARYKQLGVSEISSVPKGVRWVDVREPHEYQADHLPQAELVPLAVLEQVAASWDRQKPVLVLCRSGGRSQRGCEILAAMGFQDITNLSGGMLAVRSR